MLRYLLLCNLFVTRKESRRLRTIMMTLDLAIYLRPKIESGHERSILFSYALFLRILVSRMEKN